MPDKVFLDTNILVYLSNEDSPFHAGVLKMFADIKNQSEFWISRQVLREYAVIVSRPDFIEIPLDADSVVTSIEKWEAIFAVADETEETTKALKKLILSYDIKGKRIHDANIVATMMANKIPNLFTINVHDFKDFSEIKTMELTI